ncbi:hypothetical protein FRC00_002116 [Tulasnella sp. 408]|nr:hypothetical protein FRC00_002116 [Tulasnella sp. 408]
MSAVPQNPLNPPVFEIPDPPPEFGQDGGKFYRHYDALAQEIDDDMTSGLKEQLDGMLIFAGLFAGVNTAFLALTIPLLSADPADDTNALLAQNNAILMQLVAGRNDTVPTDGILPSAAFSPSHDIFTINALFSLSLAFAIISSFLAVLGRQWLVYYRKRGGGGPDRQRWEQLRRFLGAERWKLEPILDDVLPSLLQIGLIIFCASLVLYFRHLSPTISLIVGIPLYVGLAFFVGSALCTIWDKFCPFQSPLSHLLQRITHFLSWMKDSFPSAWFHLRDAFYDRPLKRVKDKVFVIIGQVRLLTAAGLHISYSGRPEESLELLQAIALQRVICISDDRVALLNAIANIFSIRSTAAIERFWNDPALQDRFEELFRNSYKDLLQLRNPGVNPRDMAESARRLYCGAVGHIALMITLDDEWSTLVALQIDMLSLHMDTRLIPNELVLDSSSDLIGATLASGFIRYARDCHDPSDPAVQTIRNHLTAYSSAIAKCSNRRFLSIFAWTIIQSPLDKDDSRSVYFEALTKAYRGLVP